MAFTNTGGWNLKLGIGKETTEGTLETPTIALPVTDPDLGQEVGRAEWAGLYGSRVAPKQHDLVTTLGPRGRFTVPADNLNIVLLLELLTGTGASPFVPASTLSAFSLCADIGEKQLQHAGCKVQSIAFEASQADQVLKGLVEYIGRTETWAAAGAETIPAFVSTLSPYLFRQVVLELADVAFYAESLRLTYSNNLVADVFRNSQSRLKIPEGPATIEGELGVDFSADNYTAMIANVALGTFAKLEAEFTYAADRKLKLQCDSIKFPDKTIQQAREGLIMTRLPFAAKASTVSGTDLITITLTNPV